MTHFVKYLILLWMGAGALSAQGYDVVSIKPSKLPYLSAGFYPRGVAGMDFTSANVAMLIQYAWSLRNYQVAGLPEWDRTTYWEVQVRDSNAAPNPKDDRHKVMSDNFLKLRAVVLEHFGVKFHMEKRKVAARSMQVADAKKLHAAPCGNAYRLDRGYMKAEMPLAYITGTIARDLELPVTDDTGMKGCFDIELRYTTDMNNTELPSIETALGDYGLVLKKTTAEVDVMVVDAVKKPETD